MQQRLCFDEGFNLLDESFDTTLQVFDARLQIIGDDAEYGAGHF
jgi:hypothetical protein